jgi:hypothetical protein
MSSLVESFSVYRNAFHRFQWALQAQRVTIDNDSKVSHRRFAFNSGKPFAPKGSLNSAVRHCAATNSG